MPPLSSQDYSFIDTPALPAPPNSTIVLRRALANPRIPVYIEEDILAWGSPPTPQFKDSAAQQLLLQQQQWPTGESHMECTA